MTELEKLKIRYENIKKEGGDLTFTLGDNPGSFEEIAAVANAMLDYIEDHKIPDYLVRGHRPINSNKPKGNPPNCLGGSIKARKTNK